MKKVILLLPFIVLLFTISCSDMAKQVSNPEGIEGAAERTGVWDYSKWDKEKWGP